METKGFLKEHYFAQILTLSEHRDEVLKRLLEKPKSNGLVTLYELLTKALSETESKLLDLDDGQIWTWEDEKADGKEKENEAIWTREDDDDDDEIEGEIEEDYKESENTRIVAESELVTFEDGKKGVAFDVDPTLWTLVLAMDGMGCWRLQAQKDKSIVQVPVYRIKKEQMESIKASFRHFMGHRQWVQMGLPSQELHMRFGACITVTKENFKWGVQPGDLSPDDYLNHAPWNEPLKTNVDSIDFHF